MNQEILPTRSPSITEIAAVVKISSAAQFFRLIGPLTGEDANKTRLSRVKILIHGFSRQCVAALKCLLLVIGFSGRTWAVMHLVAWGNPDIDDEFQVPPDLTNAIAVVPTIAPSALALRTDGTIVEFGPNAPSQAAPPSGLSNVVSISSGGFAVGALKRDGTVVAWGDNSAGQTNVPPGLSNIVAISFGDHNLALRSDGQVFAWGYNYSGDTEVPPDLDDVVAVASGGFFSMALRGDGTVRTWGDSFFGEQQVPTNLTNVVAIAAGLARAFAVRADGTVAEWGSYPAPLGGIRQNVQSGANLKEIAAIAASPVYNLGLTAKGTVVGWGIPGIEDSRYRTNAPPWLTNVTAISTSGLINLALLEDEPFPSHPAMMNPHLDSEGFSISIPSQSGRVFRLEYKSAIADPTWTGLNLVAGNGGTLTLRDSNPEGAQRFYRVRRW